MNLTSKNDNLNDNTTYPISIDVQNLNALEDESKKIQKDIEKLENDMDNLKERIDLLVSDKLLSISDSIDLLQFRLTNIIKCSMVIGITFIIGVVIFLMALTYH